MDWFSRYLVDWQLDQSLEIGFVLDTMKRASNRRKPGIVNSDQGSHFTSPKYIELLKSNEVRISVDGKGRATENIVIERFWRSLKYNEVYLNDYETPRETRRGIERYIHMHNHYLPHQSLKNNTFSRAFAWATPTTSVIRRYLVIYFINTKRDERCSLVPKEYCVPTHTLTISKKLS